MLRYLALGDSYTIGEGIAPEGRWPRQLAGRLQALGVPLAEPRILAQTGWTCAELAAALDAAEPPGPWDLVTLLIGVNDQYRGHPPAQLGADYAALLERALALAGGRPARVLAVSIPDWGVTPFARRELRSPARIARELDACNALESKQCAARGIAFADVTALSRAAGDAADMLAEDGLHPSAAQYARWTAALLPYAERALAAA